VIEESVAGVGGVQRRLEDASLLPRLGVYLHDLSAEDTLHAVDAIGSRSLPVGGSALNRTVERLIDNLTPAAAEWMEAAVADLKSRVRKFAVAALGVDEINMPASPFNVWFAIGAAEARARG
jgi:hypothetical protein